MLFEPEPPADILITGADIYYIYPKAQRQEIRYMMNSKTAAVMNSKIAAVRKQGSAARGLIAFAVYDYRFLQRNKKKIASAACTLKAHTC